MDSARDPIIMPEEPVTGLTLIIGILSILLIAAAALVFFERYFPNVSDKTLIRIIIIGFGINIAILFFIIMSYNKVYFKPGVQGPKGIRGPPGPQGPTSGISGCKKAEYKLGNLKKQVATAKHREYSIPKPVILNSIKKK